jgi:hypothetical protein
MLTKIFIVFVVAVSVVFNSNLYASELHYFVPEAGFVTDKATAISIAEAVLFPIYGKKEIEGQKPYNVELVGNVWTITGTLSCCSSATDCICLGGVFLIQISKQDGKILRVTHSR